MAHVSRMCDIFLNLKLGNMALWNEKDLSPPPVNTYRAITKDIDIKILQIILQEGEIFYKNAKHLDAEGALLSKCIQKMKHKFRASLDFKSLKKVNKALENYKQLNISEIIKSFIDVLPERYDSDDTYLPTRNMLDFILVKLQGLGKLMVRIVDSARDTAYLYEKRLLSGHFWKIGIIILALVSRIYILSKHVTLFTCTFYSRLLQFASQFENTTQWIPENYIFPKDLKEWLDVDWLDMDEEIVEIPDEVLELMQFFDLTESDDEVEFIEANEPYDDIRIIEDDFGEELITINDDDDEVEFVEEHYVKKRYNPKKSLHVLKRHSHLNGGINENTVKNKRMSCIPDDDFDKEVGWNEKSCFIIEDDDLSDENIKHQENLNDMTIDTERNELCEDKGLTSNEVIIQTGKKNQIGVQDTMKSNILNNRKSCYIVEDDENISHEENSNKTRGIQLEMDINIGEEVSEKDEKMSTSLSSQYMKNSKEIAAISINNCTSGKPLDNSIYSSEESCFIIDDNESENISTAEVENSHSENYLNSTEIRQNKYIGLSDIYDAVESNTSTSGFQYNKETKDDSTSQDIRILPHKESLEKGINWNEKSCFIVDEDYENTSGVITQRENLTKTPLKPKENEDMEKIILSKSKKLSSLSDAVFMSLNISHTPKNKKMKVLTPKQILVNSGFLGGSLSPETNWGEKSCFIIDEEEIENNVPETTLKKHDNLHPKVSTKNFQAIKKKTSQLHSILEKSSAATTNKLKYLQNEILSKKKNKIFKKQGIKRKLEENGCIYENENKKQKLSEKNASGLLNKMFKKQGIKRKLEKNGFIYENENKKQKLSEKNTSGLLTNKKKKRNKKKKNRQTEPLEQDTSVLLTNNKRKGNENKKNSQTESATNNLSSKNRNVAQNIVTNKNSICQTSTSYTMKEGKMSHIVSTIIGTIPKQVNQYKENAVLPSKQKQPKQLERNVGPCLQKFTMKLVDRLKSVPGKNSVNEKLKMKRKSHLSTQGKSKPVKTIHDNTFVISRKGGTLQKSFMKKDERLRISGDLLTVQSNHVAKAEKGKREKPHCSRDTSLIAKIGKTTNKSLKKKRKSNDVAKAEKGKREKPHCSRDTSLIAKIGKTTNKSLKKKRKSSANVGKKKIHGGENLNLSGPSFFTENNLQKKKKLQDNTKLSKSHGLQAINLPGTSFAKNESNNTRKKKNNKQECKSLAAEELNSISKLTYFKSNKYHSDIIFGQNTNSSKKHKNKNSSIKNKNNKTRVKDESSTVVLPNSHVPDSKSHINTLQNKCNTFGQTNSVSVKKKVLEDSGRKPHKIHKRKSLDKVFLKETIKKRMKQK